MVCQKCVHAYVLEYAYDGDWQSHITGFCKHIHPGCACYAAACSEISMQYVAAKNSKRV